LLTSCYCYSNPSVPGFSVIVGIAIVGLVPILLLSSILLQVSLVLLAFRLLLTSYTVVDLPSDGGLSAADTPGVAGVHAVTSVHAIDNVPAVSVIPAIQRWAKAPIDQSSDTDLIFGLYRSLLSSDSLIDQNYFCSYLCIRQLIQSLLSSDSLFNQSCFLVLRCNFSSTDCIGQLETNCAAQVCTLFSSTVNP
jgi:hypothetical protein